MTNEQHASLDDVAGMTAEIGLTLRYQQQAIDGIVPLLRTQQATLTSIDGQLSAVNATLQAILRQLQQSYQDR